MKAVAYRRPGDPTDVLEVVDVDAAPAPRAGQVKVRVTTFPIHPGDLQAVQGARGPGVAGVEATGEVLEAGAGVALAPGSRVTVFLADGAWRQEVTIDAELAVAVPDSVSEEVAAQMLVNPVTVVMLRRAAERHFGVGYEGVVLNNAAASAVGRLFTAGAEHHRIASVGVVRSAARADELRTRFPDVPVVSTDAADWTTRVREAAAGRPIAVALDPIGGRSSAELVSLLEPGGELVLYGMMAPEPLPLYAETLVHGDLTVRGLTIARWWAATSPAQRASDLASAVAITQGLAAQFDVAAIYPLDDIRAAAAHVSRPGKIGTVLVTI